MDGLARTGGTLPQTFEVNGKQYTLRPPAAVDLLGGAEARIVAGREDPIAIAARACQHAPPAQHEAIWQAAMRLAAKAQQVSQEDVEAYLTTLDGVAFATWLSLKEDHPGEFPSAEQVKAFLLSLEPAKLEEIAAKIQVASGMQALGNSSGPSRKARAEAEGERKAASPAGRKSTGISQTSTATRQKK